MRQFGKKLSGGSSRKDSARGPHRLRRQLRVEHLEQRQLLAGSHDLWLAVPNAGDSRPAPAAAEALFCALDPGEGESDQKLVKFRLETADLAGNPVSSLAVGDRFVLNVFAQDLRAISKGGVFSSYLDVTYDASMATVSGAIVRKDRYPNMPSGNTSQPGIIDEAGGFDGMTPLGGGEHLVLSVPFVANRVGTLRLRSDPADASPDHDILLYAMNATVQPGQIDFGETSLTIVQVQVIDNGDAGFSKAGSWTQTKENAHQGDIHRSAKGKGADAASWTFNVMPGQYRVSATWNTHKNRATNAPFAIFDGGTPLGTVLVNQELAPSGGPSQGTPWQDLDGPYLITSNTLVVRLTDAANDYVIADAVRVERLPDAPDIEVRAGATKAAVFSLVDFGVAEPYATTVTVRNTADRTITVRNVGTQPLTLTLNPMPPGFLLVGNSALPTLASGESTSLTIRMQWAEEKRLSGILTIGTNDPDESVYNLTLSGKVSWPPAAQIIDNGAAGFWMNGRWTSRSRVGYEGDIHYRTKGKGDYTAGWTFNVTPGKYYVWTTWNPDRSNATNAPFSVHAGTQNPITVLVNQKVAPSGLPSDGTVWYALGELYDIISGPLVVTLNNAADGRVVADAVRIERWVP